MWAPGIGVPTPPAKRVPSRLGAARRRLRCGHPAPASASLEIRRQQGLRQPAQRGGHAGGVHGTGFVGMGAGTGEQGLYLLDARRTVGPGDAHREVDEQGAFLLRHLAAPGGVLLEVAPFGPARVFADSRAGTLRPEREARYQRVIATLPADWAPVGDTALDADGQWLYFRVGPRGAARRVPPELKIEPAFGPRRMGAGPTGIARVYLQTGEIRHVATMGFQIGHIQANPWVPGELVFSWETGGKSPPRTWTVRGDGSGLRLLYPESAREWVTHEAIITREKPAGLAIVNLRTREMRIEAQTPSGSGLWHVHGSPDGRWAVGDDFARDLYLPDRRSGASGGFHWASAACPA